MTLHSHIIAVYGFCNDIGLKESNSYYILQISLDYYSSEYFFDI